MREAALIRDIAIRTHTVNYMKLVKFNSVEELKRWIATNEKSYSPKKYEAIFYDILTVETSIEVKLK
jgi:hypothetical protein